MTNITEVSNFDADVKRYDLTDPVVGDVTGESNLPIIALANRSRFLYDYLNGRSGVETVTASATIDATYLRKLVYVNISTNITLTLAALSNFKDGQRLSFAVKTTGVKCARFTPADGTIANMPAGYTGLWLHDGEMIELERISGSLWWLHDIKTNLEMVGSDGMVRFMPKNTLVANGNAGVSLPLRADMARLWDRVNGSGAAITEALWFSNQPNNQSLYSIGNTSTTFRIPDMRSISWRALDLSRGLSFTRLNSVPGGYEPDQLGQHEDTTGNEAGSNTTDIPALAYTGGPSPFRRRILNVGKETIVKNAGLIPIIYY